MTLFSTATGPIGQDAETREVNGKYVTNFSVATKHYDYQKKENVTQWVSCAIWGDRGIKLREYLVKGQWVNAIGEQTIRQYEHKGEHRVSVEIDVTRVVLCGKPQERKQEGAMLNHMDEKHGVLTGPNEDDGLPF